MDKQDNLTPEEQQQLMTYMSMNYPKPEEKTGIFHFFNKILGLKDTSKAGNLDTDELNSIRALKRAKLYSDKMGLNEVSEYLEERSEIILATSLSKDMSLIKAAITSKKESKASIKTGEDKKWLKNKNKD